MLRIGRRGSTICWAVLAAVLGSQAFGADPSPEEIMRRALDLRAEVQDYTATVTMAADFQGAPESLPEYKVYFKRPDKVHIESKSIVVARREMFTFGNIAKKVEEGCNVVLMGKRSAEGVPIYVVKLIPKEAAEGNTERIVLEVNGQRWTVEGFEFTDGTESHAKFKCTHTLVQGKYWMPASISCNIPEAPGRDGTPPASMSVTFSNYTVNTGLADSIFEQE